MEFSENLSALASKIRQQRSMIETEEATKNAFIMPFISTVLGYDVFDPREVVPEFTADVGTKKGEKIDYAILHEGEVQVLIECKRSKGDLRIEDASQLFRYFAATNARIAVLTNGEIYQLYTDLDKPNRMDAKPFLVLDMMDIDETLIPELQKLSKSIFDVDSVISAAEELKYIGQLKRSIASEFAQPEDEWVKFLTAKVYEGSFTQRVREQFTPLVYKAMSQFLNDQVNGRLKSALGATTLGPSAATDATTTAGDAHEQPHEDSEHQDDGIETTVEEREAFHIIRAIACSDIEPSRIVYRDAKSYCAILVDDNNRKPVARLHFNRSQKYLGLLDDHKAETRQPIDSLADIYKFSDELRTAVKNYS